MTQSSSGEVTCLLKACSSWGETAFDQMLPLACQELHWRAERYMANKRSGHTLQTTALVNEVYIRLDVEETAQVLKVSRETVMRDRKMAKVWLVREISRSVPRGT